MPKTSTSGQGRKRGVPNKNTADIRAMVLTALNTVGGAKYLARQAEKNPVAFMGLIGKVMPLQVQASGGGAFLLEQLAVAAAALRERREVSPAALPAPAGQIIDAEPVINGKDDESDLSIIPKTQ